MEDEEVLESSLRLWHDYMESKDRCLTALQYQTNLLKTSSEMFSGG